MRVLEYQPDQPVWAEEIFTALPKVVLDWFKARCSCHLRRILCNLCNLDFAFWQKFVQFVQLVQFGQALSTVWRIFRADLEICASW